MKVQQLSDIIGKIDVRKEDFKTSEASGKKICELQGEIQVVSGQNKNLKNEIKNVNAKYEKVIIENRSLKTDIENIGKELKNVSVALKSSEKDLKENMKNHDIERAKFEKEIKQLVNHKEQNEANEREKKKKEKKIIKKGKKRTEQSC